MRTLWTSVGIVLLAGCSAPAGGALPAFDAASDAEDAGTDPAPGDDAGPGAPDAAVAHEDAGVPPPPDAGGGRTPLRIGIMVHLEGRTFSTAMDLERFAALIESYAEVFASHGARLTLESGTTTEPSVRFGNDFLARLHAMGHHVAVHADLGGRPDPTYTTERMTSDLLRMRAQLDTLGIDHRHVSGICSTVDWPRAARDAGFEFVTGGVAYCLMSLPREDRPAEYRDCANAAACHDVWPAELEGRLHPWRMRIGSDWRIDDPSGEVVMLPSSGGLVCAAEEAVGENCDAVLEDEDIELNLAEIDEALALVDPSRVNVYYLSWSIGASQPVEMLERFLARVDPYVADGRVTWATLPEMYDEYVAWERASGRR